MTAKLVPFLPEHVDTLELQPAQRGLAPLLEDQGYLEYLAGNDSYSFVDEDGKTLACAGILPKWTGVALCWSFISDMGPRQFYAWHREVEQVVVDSTTLFWRLEMSVDCDFTQGHRWAKLLGFEVECERMKRFTSTDKDATSYVRLSEFL